MISVTVNGKPLQGDYSSLRTMGELVEFVKVNIDPDVIITGLSLNGRELTEVEWRSALAGHTTGVLEVVTGAKEVFLNDRLEIASVYVDRIRDEFSKVQALFRQGITADSHTKLGGAVQDLKAFVDWYETLIQMLPNDRTELKDDFHEQVKRLTDVCEQILQQQLYRAWWALAETIERKLDPELERLKGCCLKVVNN
ncbi:MAG: hypothetical protein IT290_07100 [Deltaproteobacteria bacterium]|nr:hypothetical protein [Deltaproteobacteria bacterium]